MGRRLDLQEILEKIVPNVYFQPPESIKMKYPCIVYERDSADTIFADNIPYRIINRYSVVVIDRDPDTEIPDQVATLPMCSFDRFYISDNLNHYVYTLYF